MLKKSFFILIMCFLSFSVVTHAAELMTCRFENGGFVKITSEPNSQKAVLSLDSNAQSFFKAASDNGAVPLTVEYQDNGKGAKFTRSLETGGWVTGGWKCSMLIYFMPTNKRTPIGAALPVDPRAEFPSEYSCGHTRARIVGCEAGPRLESLLNLQNFAKFEIED